MADAILTAPRPFPDGTEVKAYLVTNWPGSLVRKGAAPVGAEADTQTMTSGTLTFTGLAQDGVYVAHAEVGGEDRYVDFIAGADTSATGVVTRSELEAELEAATDDIPLSNLVQPNIGSYFAVPTIGPAAVTATANYLWVAQVSIPWTATITGIAYYVGGTSNGNVRSALYSSAAARVANRTTNSAQPAANSAHAVAFDAPYVAAPGTYLAALVFSSSTATFFGGQGMVPSVFELQGGFTTPATVVSALALAIVPFMTTY